MRRLLVPALLLAVAAILPGNALGKGASEATITGPGLEAPVVLAGEDQVGGYQLMSIAEQSGFFPAVFEQASNSMLTSRPSGELGPVYRVEYVLPGPNNEEDTVVQHLYPYASPSPVTYVEPGQPYWTTDQTGGGWYLAGATLRDSLVGAGLPATAPTVGSASPSDSPWSVIGPIAALVAIGAAAAIGAAVLMRRGPQMA